MILDSQKSIPPKPKAPLAPLVLRPEGMSASPSLLIYIQWFLLLAILVAAFTQLLYVPQIAHFTESYYDTLTQWLSQKLDKPAEELNTLVTLTLNTLSSSTLVACLSLCRAVKSPQHYHQRLRYEAQSAWSKYDTLCQRYEDEIIHWNLHYSELEALNNEYAKQDKRVIELLEECVNLEYFPNSQHFENGFLFYQSQLLSKLQEKEKNLSYPLSPSEYTATLFSLIEEAVTILHSLNNYLNNGRITDKSQLDGAGLALQVCATLHSLNSKNSHKTSLHLTLLGLLNESRFYIILQSYLYASDRLDYVTQYRNSSLITFPAELSNKLDTQISLLTAYLHLVNHKTHQASNELTQARMLIDNATSSQNFLTQATQMQAEAYSRTGCNCKALSIIDQLVQPIENAISAHKKGASELSEKDLEKQNIILLFLLLKKTKFALELGKDSLVANNLSTMESIITLYQLDSTLLHRKLLALKAKLSLQQGDFNKSSEFKRSEMKCYGDSLYRYNSPAYNLAKFELYLTEWQEEYKESSPNDDQIQLLTTSYKQVYNQFHVMRHPYATLSSLLIADIYYHHNRHYDCLSILRKQLTCLESKSELDTFLICNIKYGIAQAALELSESKFELQLLTSKSQVYYDQHLYEAITSLHDVEKFLLSTGKTCKSSHVLQQMISDLDISQKNLRRGNWKSPCWYQKAKKHLLSPLTHKRFESLQIEEGLKSLLLLRS